MDALLLIIVFLPILSNLIINVIYTKYSKVNLNTNLTGREVARKILDKNGLYDVDIITIRGLLSDNYNPKTKIVSLSNDIANSSSISAVSVAAHEVGHAIQDKEGYSFMKFRSSLVPIVNFTSRFSTLFVILGIVFEISNLYMLGILCLSTALLFHLITLPVEFNASSRARNQLNDINIISNRSDNKSVKKVLNAAAFTYVANFFAMLLQVLKLISFKNRD